MDIRDLEFGRFKRLCKIVHEGGNIEGGKSSRSLGRGLVEHRARATRGYMMSGYIDSDSNVTLQRHIHVYATPALPHGSAVQ